MSEIPDISRDAIMASLRTSFLGRSIVAEQELPSTNSTAALLAENGAPDGLVVIADKQTAGRGRNGRSWQSPPGKNLYFSALLRPQCPVQATPQLAIMAALSVAEALNLEGRCVKWPNDIWRGGAKLCGILCSMSSTGHVADYAVIGIGVNVNLSVFPEDIRGTSLAMEFGREFSRANVLAAILNSLEKDYVLWRSSFSLTPFMERWKAHSILDGQKVSAEHGRELVTGIAEGITPEGLLALRGQDGSTRLVAAGDTHILMEQ